MHIVESTTGVKNFLRSRGGGRRGADRRRSFLWWLRRRGKEPGLMARWRGEENDGGESMP